VRLLLSVHDPKSVCSVLDAATPSIDSEANRVTVILFVAAVPVTSLIMIGPEQVAGLGSAKLLAAAVLTQFILLQAKVTFEEMFVFVGKLAELEEEEELDCVP